MKMRLAFVRAILHQPRLLFLDEPTSGLDPAFARILKDMILEQKKAGRTVVLTTHNMHDAEELCDRVAFIVDGAIRALDTPAALRGRKTGVEVHFTYENEEQIIRAHAPLDSLQKNADFMHHLQNGTLRSIHSREPTLEDVFIELTGRQLS
jgi:fluoroquinolone transport system ATP-binding protein